MQCIVPSCGSKMGKNKELIFHEFPANMERRERWISTLRAHSPQDFEEPWLPAEYAKICSKHFTPADYIQGPKKRYLAPHAVPSQFQSTADGKASKGRKGRPRKVRQEKSTPSLLAASALASNATATGSDRDQTPPAKRTTNRPVVIRRLRGIEASASLIQNPMPVIVDVRSESRDSGSVVGFQDDTTTMPVIADVRSEICDGGSDVRPSGGDGLPPGRQPVGRSTAPSIACQTQVTGLTISAYEEQIQSLKNECKVLRNELFALRRLAQARKRCRACDNSVADNDAAPG